MEEIGIEKEEEREEVKREGDGKVGSRRGLNRAHIWKSAIQQKIKVKCLYTTVSKQTCS